MAQDTYCTGHTYALYTHTQGRYIKKKKNIGFVNTGHDFLSVEVDSSIHDLN